jgi:serine/threonine protein kinase
MKQLKVTDFLSTGLDSAFDQISSIEIHDKVLAEGGFGEVYECISINGNKNTPPQIIKVFKNTANGSSELNYQTIQRLQVKLAQKSKNLQGQNLLEAYPAFVGIPQFSFIATLNGQKVKGFSSYNLKALGFEEFKDILDKESLLDKYQGLSIESKMLIAYNFVSAFKVLKECFFIHADIKPEAIFINMATSTCAIIDFDSGVVTDNPSDDATTWGAPNEWIAPEIWTQLKKAGDPNARVKVDLFTDSWSVAIGVHFFMTTCHPLFFLNEISPNVMNSFHNKYKDRWPNVTKTAPYFNSKYLSIYDRYAGFLQSQAPAEVIKQLDITINQGYNSPHMRTSYDKWQSVLKNIQQPPEIESFIADKRISITGLPIKLQWKVKKAKQIIIDNGVGDVTNVMEISVSPDKPTCYKLTATNFYGEATQEVHLKVFPTPVMESILVPTPSFERGMFITGLNIPASTTNFTVNLNSPIFHLSFPSVTAQTKVSQVKPLFGKTNLSISEILEKIKESIINNVNSQP